MGGAAIDYPSRPYIFLTIVFASSLTSSNLPSNIYDRMSGLANNEVYTIAQAEVNDAPYAGTNTEKHLGRGSIDLAASSSSDSIDDYKIDEGDLHSLRRVSGKIPWTAFSVAFVELCERFSYYGTTVVCKSPTLKHCVSARH
jgi:hypothetical protein